ncbi:MAG: hypothetical protein QOJ33_1311 [Chloroflexota bacterium]|jgi:hypothetical protein|nr:hypothetical protein [Chloroflexota bacterium]MEA2668377.1 hypothetical protein [Chloroflexota bacterium]
MLPVLVAIAAISVVAFLAFRWFERYRYGDSWRTSEFRGVAFGFLMWFGGIFGHRVPPPPQAKVEFATKAEEPEPPGSGGPTLPNQAADDKE